MIMEIAPIFFIIFIAELGDKSQILAMSFATRYKLTLVLSGVFIGILVNHALAVVLGMMLGTIIISHYITYLVGMVFVLFAYLTLFNRGEEETSKIANYGPIATISLAFFLGELGDKTQIATMAFASDSQAPFLILMATVPAMMLVSYIGIIVGRKLGEQIPDYYIRLASSLLFISYGIIKLFEAYEGTLLSDLSFTMILSLILVTYVSIFLKSVMVYRREEFTTFQRVAKHLRVYNQSMDTALESICLGESFCGSCKGKDCIIGHTKHLIEQSKEGRPVDPSNLNEKVFKDVDKADVLKAIDITLDEIKDYWDDPTFNILHSIRHNLDYLLFEVRINVESYREYHQMIMQYKESL